ncbi:MAG: M23 family metallopeptidase [Deltaproteobacteria bacterium]|nr:M23 family metallopeptidase [bacterium]MCB9475469.1 M23 family metallopeptidase [Deltaproteobacteria bacterium]MCB9488528.1 M23 family metallopeptidase [Deltaproteobacteria bacterium]
MGATIAGDRINQARRPWILAAAVFVLALVSGCGYYITVERGDTLNDIAREYGVTTNDLIEANPNLKDPNRIYPGQKLRIPREKSLVVAEGAQKRPGDTNKSALKEPSEIPPRATTTSTPASTPPPARSAVRSTPPPAATAEKTEAVGAGGAVSTGSPSFIWPVNGTILRGFGKGPDGRINEGIDIAAPAGTDIKAVADGEVLLSNNKLKGYGNMIVVQHNGGFVSIYAHNRINHVKKGDKVRQGQVIGEVGDTGRASQPHLHFEIRKNIKTIDPYPLLPRR